MVTITKGALIQRINRILKKTNNQVREDRSNGTYYILDKGKLRIVLQDIIELEPLGRELGALQSFEQLESSSTVLSNAVAQLDESFGPQKLTTAMNQIAGEDPKRVVGYPMGRFPI